MHFIFALLTFILSFGHYVSVILYEIPPKYLVFISTKGHLKTTGGMDFIIKAIEIYSKLNVDQLPISQNR